MTLAIPGYWVKNIRKLEDIVSSNVCYIDLVRGENAYSIYLSDEPWATNDYGDHNLVIFRFTSGSMHSLKGRVPTISDSWEAMTAAAMLTVFGAEVYLSTKIRHSVLKDEVGFDDIEEKDGEIRRDPYKHYELFSSHLEDQIVFQTVEDEEMTAITGEERVGLAAPVRNQEVDHKGRMSVEEFLD